ncbi:AAA family ATPase [Desulfovibrio sp. DV]|uniref:AAA family ATPase n=1 Tax=Desulfovibrio sp. DV TaxID=1844708 RepID=UPI0020CA1219|nr:AAA family ATPase [Desulfovibrio sp. DV]
MGKNGENQYSEFHFGAGESSIIRMISEIEMAQPNSLILIEEIENGLHPVATQRMVEYLIDAARRKSIQAIFTTHSDYALSPLPNEAIWACIDGKLRQGKLSIEALRAVSGRVDKKLAIFVEDEFAKSWVDSILREKLGSNFEQVEVHAVAGDGSAVSIHKYHNSNPAISFSSLCIIDGDSRQTEDQDNGIIRLPGENPELKIFDDVIGHAEDMAILTVSCQRDPASQDIVTRSIHEVSCTNRDPHLIFSQLGIQIGWVPETIVRGAFLSLWIRRNNDFCDLVATKVLLLLQRE